MQGFARISAAVPHVRVAGVEKNRDETLNLLARAHEEGAQVVVFPELGLASYTARDLFLDRVLLDGALASLAAIVEASKRWSPLTLVGLPLRTHVGIYNVAAVVQGGELLGLIPKSYLPNYREFEERRWFRPGTEVPAGGHLRVLGRDVPFGTDLLFEADGMADFVVGVEICEDVFVQTPPSSLQVSAGATLICNLSASNFLIGKAELRKLLCAAASERGKCAYLYVAAGPSESSTDLAFDGHSFVYENGLLLAESKRFMRASKLLTVDIDLEQLVHDREVINTFGDCASESSKRFRRIPFRARDVQGLLREVPPHPFVPKDVETLAARCWETFEIQTNALATRLEGLGGSHKLILGLSGGLDSTHAALVAANALDLLGRPREDLICVTMPGFGSSNETQDNAERLAHALSASFERVSIADLSRSVLAALGHPAGAESIAELLARVRKDPKLADITFENVQARLRTLLLMSVANRQGGIVVGTGDLSEKALGWSTYAGDQISMYDVNAGVPKTLIQFLIRWVANERVGTWSSGDPTALREILFAILETPISPELLPPDEAGKIAQLTESTLGPYELHDFFLYHFVRYGRKPSRILGLATHAFEGRYDSLTIRRWLELFLRRFFANQFKRSCTPDGPKVGTVALSPRGDWRMPSDADVASWLAELDGAKQ
ncbi:MAG: nadE 2 [Myxococcaceae bacterium]|nr:nadE 2 [Myxococcaceae bacterium]